MALSKRILNHFPSVSEQEPVTVAIPNYNGMPDIADAIRSVYASSFRPSEILVVDDGSTDDSVAFIKEQFPNVRIVEMGRNTKMLNQVRNRALFEAKTRLVFLMDHDVTLEPNCLAVLVTAMSNLHDAAVLTTRALSQNDRQRIYVDVQRLHFLCNSVAFNRGGCVSKAKNVPQKSIGWGTQLIDKLKAEAVGFFDEDYVMGWGDDGEFHHKIHICGLGCYSVPTARVLHKRHEGARRIYGGIRNRWYLIIETYALRTLIVLIPSLFFYELSLFALLCIKGQAGTYFRAMKDVVVNLPRLLTKRKKLQRLRSISDRELLVSGPIFIRKDLIGRSILGHASELLIHAFDGYWHFAHRFI